MSIQEMIYAQVGLFNRDPAATAARYPSADGATHAEQGLGETQRSFDGIAEKS